MTLAVVAPAAPAIPYALMALTALVAYLFSLGLLHGWGRTFGPVLRWLGNKQISIPHVHAFRPFTLLLKWDQDVRDGLGRTVLATERALVHFTGLLIASLRGLAHEVSALATTVADAFDSLVLGTLPAKVRALTAKQWALLRRVPALTRRLDALREYIHRQVNHAVATAIGLSTRLTHTAVAGAEHLGELAWRRTASQARRLTRLEKLLLGAGVATIGLRILSRLRLGWLRCTNVNKVGRRLCGLDPTLLETLLLDSLLVFGTISLVEFAKEVGDVTEFADGAIRKFVRAV